MGRKISVRIPVASLVAAPTGLALVALGLWLSGLDSPIGAAARPGPQPVQLPVKVYDPNPQHLWNRLHRALWVRTGPDGKEYGHDRLDPLLWLETKHLVEGRSHEQAIEVLDEFLAKRGEKLVKEPLKRAILQRDLWAVFDWAAEPGASVYLPRQPPPRRALQLRLAQIIQRLALTSDQIKALPDNYAAAVAGRAFAEQHDADQPERPFLPPDLFQKDGPWVEVEIDNGSVVTASRHALDFGGRSCFRVFLRFPQGHKATVAYFDKLRNFPRPWVLTRERNQQHDTLVLNAELPQFPVGTQTALVRQMLLVDDTGGIATTPITESVQIRVFRTIHRLMQVREQQRETSADQNVYEFTRSRMLLFADKSGGLRPLEPTDKDFTTQLLVHNYDEFELPPDQAAFERRMLPLEQRCIGCHDKPGVYSFQSYVGRHFPRGQYYLPLLYENKSPDAQGECTAMLKREQYSWGLLQGLWEHMPRK
jgi:hypothetical protein